MPDLAIKATAPAATKISSAPANIHCMLRFSRFDAIRPVDKTPMPPVPIIPANFSDDILVFTSIIVLYLFV